MSLLRQCLSSDKNEEKLLIGCFDGGGVRGRFTLELCCKLAHKQNVPLSKLFSMLISVSAGAFIAAFVASGMLDDVKTSGHECNRFNAFMPEMFQKVNKSGPLFKPKYNGIGKTATLHKIFGKMTFKDMKTPLVILACNLNGVPVLFRSWDPSLQDILLADMLDASSAAPFFYPPVLIKNELLCDGGVRANKPLITALLTAIEYFDRGNMYFLSIGTSFASTRKFSAAKASMMGALAYLEHGLVEMLLGNHDNTSEQLMKSIFGDRFLRLECHCPDIRLDDYSSETQLRLENNAKTVWQQHETNILMFVANNKLAAVS